MLYVTCFKLNTTKSSTKYINIENNGVYTTKFKLWKLYFHDVNVYAFTNPRVLEPCLSQDADLWHLFLSTLKKIILNKYTFLCFLNLLCIISDFKGFFLLKQQKKLMDKQFLYSKLTPRWPGLVKSFTLRPVYNLCFLIG